jgi:hypothetical protein
MRRFILLLGLCGLSMAGVLTASASAALTAPVVITGAATTQTLTATTVTGTVDPVGQATTYHFEYGPTTAYGSSTPDASAGSGLLAVPVTANLTGLTPATDYHFRLVATNASGPADGADVTFTTAGTAPGPPGPPVVVTGPAAGVTSTTAVLTGTANPNGLATTSSFQYGTSTAYGQQTPAAAVVGTGDVPVSATLTGLAPATTYHYRLVATNSAGPTLGADLTVVTPGASTPSTLSVRVNPAGGNNDLDTTLTISHDAVGTPVAQVSAIGEALSPQFVNQLASFGTCAPGSFANLQGPTAANCPDRTSILGTGTIVTRSASGAVMTSDQGIIVKTAASQVTFWWHAPASAAGPELFHQTVGTITQETGLYGAVVTYGLADLPAGARLAQISLNYLRSAVNGKAPFAAAGCSGGSFAFEGRILYLGGTPELPTATVPCAVSAAASPQPAKLQVSRATISRSARTIDILAPITRRATGSVKLDLFAAGQHYDWTAAIDSTDGVIRSTHAIPTAQADKGTGILTITYAGNAATRPQVVRLRAADAHANLDVQRPTYAAGVLHDQGTISSAARGIVRVQLQYFSGGATTTLEFHAAIANGVWSLNTTLTAAQQAAIAARAGTLHSYILFTGYLPAKMRGEMDSYQVLGNP